MSLRCVEAVSYSAVAKIREQRKGKTMRMIIAIALATTLLAACQEQYSGRGYRSDSLSSRGERDSTLYRTWKDRVRDDAQTNYSD